MTVTDTRALAGLAHDDLIRLARDLAATGARDVVAACITISHVVEDDARIVGPLWSCLQSFVDDPSASESRLLVNRLLELAQSSEGFHAVQAGSPMAPAEMTPERRAFVYPFSHGVGRETNLVTLLAWADANEQLPDKQNGFLEAFARRAVAHSEWIKIERELAKTPIKVRPYPVGLLLFYGGLIFSVGYLSWIYATRGARSFAQHVLPIESFFVSLWSIIILGLLVRFLINSAVKSYPIREYILSKWKEWSPEERLRQPANPVGWLFRIIFDFTWERHRIF